MTKKQIISSLKYIYGKVYNNTRVSFLKENDIEIKPVTFYKGDKLVHLKYKDDEICFMREDFEKVFNIPYASCYNVSTNDKTGQIIITPVISKESLNVALDKGEIDVRTYNNLVEEIYK